MVDSIEDNPIPDPGNVGSIYELSHDDWAAINDRVGIVVQLQNISDAVSTEIPNYPELLAVCQKWQAITYQSLLAQSVLVGMFANSAPGILGKIVTGLGSASDDAPLSTNQQFLCRVQFEALADHAATVAANVASLLPDLTAFVAANQAADKSLAAVVQGTPVVWQSIAGPLQTLGTGLTTLSGGWTDIAAQLQQLALGQTVPATVGAMRSATASAGPAWTALGKAAVSFDQNATN